jgi:hypothetical protein
MFYKIGFFIGITLTFLIGVIVFVDNPKNRVNRIWALLSFCACVWFSSRFLLSVASSAENAYRGLRILYGGAIFLNIVYCHFCYAFLDRKVGTFIIVGYISAALIYVLNLTTTLFITGVRPLPQLNFYEIAGPLYFVHNLLYLLYPSIGFALLYKERGKTTAMKANQIN